MIKKFFQENVQPEDNRIFKEKSQIWIIKADKISQCRKTKASATVDQDLFM